MAEYIEREALRKLMYEEAFEKDSDMQRWDSGCWIRYKLFKNCIEAIPAADVVEVVRCKDCIHRPSGTGVNHDVKFPDDECPCKCPDTWYSWMPPDDWYCASGKRKGGGQDE